MEHTTQQEDQNNIAANFIDAVWHKLEFAGKEFCEADENGNLKLKAATLVPERVLSVLNPANAEAIVTALCEKFKEVEAKVEELKQEFSQSTESIKLQGKLQRLKSYLLDAKAIGDYQPMFAFISEKETEIHQQHQNNIAARKAIVDNAVAMQDSEDWKNTTESFRKIVEDWKHAPYVDKEVSDKMWSEIEAARNHFYDKKRAHQQDFETEMLQNLDLKMEICEEAESLCQSEDWKTTTEQYKNLMERWKGIGKVATAEKNDELWNRFLAAKNTFFDRKNAHQNNIVAEQEANYLAKLLLVEQAEALKDSKDWKATSAKYLEITEQWKGIGKVPFEKADELWSRMQQAKDAFFGAKREHTEQFKVGLEDNYAQKKALVERIDTLKDSNNWREATAEINELMTTWKSIGPVPKEHGDALWEQFIAARQYFFKRKDDDRDARKNRFTSQVQSRLQQSRAFLQKIEEELKEDEERLAEFSETLANTGVEDAKDLEIQAHLKNLVAQIERKLPNKRTKVADVQKQIAELEQKLQENKG